MVGAAIQDAEEVTAAWSSAAAASVSSILPRRILFHPPLRDPPLPLSSTLTPLNLPSSDQASSLSTEVRPPPSSAISQESPSQICQSLSSVLVKRIGAGLNNLGNTCFLNSVLQCLAHTPPLAAYFHAGLHKSSCRAVAFCAMCALENHVKQALSAPGSVISPNYLVKNLRCISRSFQVGRQEDAHEYMRYLIEALQKCCPPDLHFKASPNAQNNFIQKVFGGRLQSQVKCTECAYSSNTYDPFLDLSLDIVKTESLLKAFSRFMAIEVLDGENKYFCSKCKRKVRAHKQFTIDQAPHVLTVQLKRFSSSGGFGGKIDKKVQFERMLNLTPFVNSKDNGARYSLYGVLVHAGWSTHSGHYFCFIRTAADVWHRLDDCRVSQVSEKNVLEQRAYILFYIRDSGTLPVNCSKLVKEASDKFKIPQATPCAAILEAKDANANDTATCMSNHSDKVTGKEFGGTHANGLCTPNGSDQSRNGTVRMVESPGKERLIKPPIITTLFKTAEVASSASRLENADKHIQKKDCLGNGYTHKSKNAITGEKNQTPHTKSSSEEHLGYRSDGSEFLKEDTVKKQKKQLYSDKLTPGTVPNMKLTSNDKRILSLPISDAVAWQPVPRWEDSEHNAARDTSVLNEELAHCGHVLDEWDEEYDRGKRKKVRNHVPLEQELSDVSERISKRRNHMRDDLSSNNNLFQEYAAKRVQLAMNSIPLKKQRKRERVSGHRLFLKQHRFRQLSRNRHHRRKR